MLVKIMVYSLYRSPLSGYIFVWVLVVFVVLVGKLGLLLRPI